LVGIALRDAEDIWTRRAVMLSFKDRAAEALTQLLAKVSTQGETPTEGRLALLGETAAQAGAAGTTAQRMAALQSLTSLRDMDAMQRCQRVVLQSLAAAMGRGGESLTTLLKESPPETQKAIAAIFDAAANTAQDSAASEEQRREAIDLLVWSNA